MLTKLGKHNQGMLGACWTCTCKSDGTSHKGDRTHHKGDRSRHMPAPFCGLYSRNSAAAAVGCTIAESNAVFNQRILYTTQGHASTHWLWAVDNTCGHRRMCKSYSVCDSHLCQLTPSQRVGWHVDANHAVTVKLGILEVNRICHLVNHVMY